LDLNKLAKATLPEIIQMSTSNNHLIISKTGEIEIEKDLP